MVYDLVLLDCARTQGISYAELRESTLTLSQDYLNPRKLESILRDMEYWDKKSHLSIRY
jgi:hypothetical protein